MILSKLSRSVSRSTRSRLQHGSLFGGCGLKLNDAVVNSSRIGGENVSLGFLRGYLTSIGAKKSIGTRNSVENWRFLLLNPSFRRLLSSQSPNGKNYENYSPKGMKEFPKGSKNQKSQSSGIL